MSYHFINIDTGEYFYCDDHLWVSAIETAKKNGWDPYGTIYDLEYGIDDQCEFLEDEAEILFTVIFTLKENSEWDGSYTDKRNQIVDNDDSVYLTEALERTDTDPELVEFINKGSFRICSD